MNQKFGIGMATSLRRAYGWQASSTKIEKSEIGIEA
jgi:hypothetical protein